MINEYKQKWAALAIIYLLTLTTLFAQQDFQLTHYTDADGLPQNSVKFIIADNAGYIWLSTEDGLVRFEGNHFNTYSKNELHTSSNRMQAFYRDREQLYCYTADYETIAIKNGEAKLKGDTTGWLKAQIDLTIHPRGIFKNNFQIAARYLNDGSINLNYPKKDQYKQLYIYSNKDSVFQYDNQQVSLVYNDKIIRTLPYNTDEDWQFFFLNNRLYSLENNGIIANISSTVVRTKLKGDILLNPSLEFGKLKIKLLWNMCDPYQVIFYTKNEFYRGTMEKDGSITTKLLFTGFNASAENICSAYYNNKTGILFLGSSTKGMFVLTPKMFKTISAPSGENVYGAQVEYQPNMILTTGNQSFDLSKIPKIIKSNPHNTPIDYTTITKDQQTGNFWASSRQWLYLISTTTLKKIKQYQLTNSINALYQDEKENLWIGTILGELFSKATSDSLPIYYKTFPERISYLLKADSVHLFVGTTKGLYLLNLRTKDSQLIGNLETKSIRNVFKCNTGEIWVATYGDGFYLLNKGMAIPLPLDREKYLRTPHYFIEDNRGYFWIPTNKGLFQVAKMDLLAYAKNINNNNTAPPFYYYYDKDNGFKTNEFNGGCEPCAIQLSNKLQSMPTMNGLVLFNPDLATPVLPLASLFIDKIKVDSQEVEKKESIKLTEDFTQLTIKVSTPYLGNHKNLQISYALLDNGSKDTLFFPIGDNGVITLSRLPYGHYNLIIRKTNGFGTKNYNELHVGLFVQPKWFHSTWFVLTLILLFPLLCIIASNIRSKYVVRKNKELKKQIEEKTIHLRERISMQELIIRAIGHDIRTPLKYHIILTKNIKELTELQNGPLAKKMAVLNDSSQQLFQLVENFVQYLKAQNNTHIDKSRKIILNAILDHKLAFFRDITQRNRNLLLNIGTTKVVVNSDPELLSIIIHNLIDNALKVVKGGIITSQIGISKKNKPFLTISDSGPGLDPNILKWINNFIPGDQLNNAERMPINCGLGLMMVKQLGQLLRIKITAQSDMGSGTTFTLLFDRDTTDY